MSAYSKGQRVQWRRDIPPRPDKQTGTSTRETPDNGFPFVRWDDATEERQELPECVEPLAEKPVVSARDAWMEAKR